ncbi:MAG: regulatory protein LuxR [Nocardioidaceae bacterium]|nr:regulatory protein LuxR [Nocardioidaceae bacterium]
MSVLSVDRVRTQLDALGSVGLDTMSFASAATEVLHQALPFTAACLATADPATEIVTGTVKWGGLTNDQDDQWAYHEYEAEDLYDFRDVVRRPGAVTTVRQETGGAPELSRRFAEFFHPTYGFNDELRAALRVDGLTWGFLALFREGRSVAFTPAEQAFVSNVSPLFARGFRAGLVNGLVSSGELAQGPAVVVIDAHGDVVQASAGAAAQVSDLGGGALGESPLPLAMRTLVGEARSFAAGRRSAVPSARLRTRSGRWVLAHASPLLSRHGGPLDIVVTIEDARPPEIVPLIVSAFGLTPREQEVVQLVLQGVATAEIARTLFLSAYTVQDHLKSIFEKSGVRSRRELTARVFFDQYAPRLAAHDALGPSGWFVAE